MTDKTIADLDAVAAPIALTTAFEVQRSGQSGTEKDTLSNLKKLIAKRSFPLKPMTPATSSAPLDTRSGGSTPAEAIPILSFVDASDTFFDFCGRLEGYQGGGLTLKLPWLSTATSGDAVIGAAIRRLANDAEAVGDAHSYDFNEVTETVASASGEVKYSTITFSDGADMDSLADGEVFILRIRRNGDDASDTLSAALQLWFDAMTLVETP